MDARGAVTTAGSNGRAVSTVGCHEFRNRFGYYLERAAGAEIEISRRGDRYARLVPAM